MSNHRINLRYATALFDFAAEKNKVEETFNDVQIIADICDKSRELRVMLKSPIVFSDKKIKVINEIFKDKIGVVTRTFVDILIRKHREEHLPGISHSFIELYRKSKGIKVAIITSAKKLEKSSYEQLISILTEQTKSEIILNELVDPDIIGGLIVEIEGVKFDDSIRKKIQTLQQEFNINTYIKGF